MMNAQLAELCEQFRLNAARAQRVVSKAGQARIAVRPRPDSWSAAECLGHLTIATEMFLPVWRSAFAEARARGLREKGPFRMELMGRAFRWALEPPPKLRVKAPAIMEPVIARDEPAGFLSAQAQLLEMLPDSIGLALDRVKIASPVGPRFHYSVWSSLRLTEVHQRRHLWQAERAVSLAQSGLSE